VTFTVSEDIAFDFLLDVFWQNRFRDCFDLFIWILCRSSQILSPCMFWTLTFEKFHEDVYKPNFVECLC